jgi:HEAT repeat protein
MRDVAQWDERIAAHLDGLLLAGEAAVPLLEESLNADDPQAVFAAAYVLLRLNTQSAADRVAEALLKAEGEKIEGLAQALCHGPIHLVEGKLRGAAASAPAPAAVAALLALTFHRRPDAGVDRLVEFLQNENPQIRRAAWRIMALMSPNER